jgi:hypothetical protein
MTPRRPTLVLVVSRCRTRTCSHYVALPNVLTRQFTKGRAQTTKDFLGGRTHPKKIPEKTPDN